MVIRLVSVSDHLEFSQFHDLFRALLGWSGDPGYLETGANRGLSRFHRWVPLLESAP